MRTIKTTPVFDRAMKKIRKYSNFKIKKFEDAITKLRNGEPLDPTYSDHKTAKHSPKEWGSSRIFHAAPNICVVYQLTDKELILQAIGSHSDLFEQFVV